MSEKQPSSLSDLFEGVFLSDPLRTYKSNVQAISQVVGMTALKITGYEAEIRAKLNETRKRIADIQKDLQEIRKDLDNTCRIRSEAQSLKKQAGAIKNASGVDECLKTIRWADGWARKWRQYIKKFERLKKDNDSYAMDQMELLQTYRQQRAVLTNMAFVYLVTIWDAFVLDTVRRILRVHPQLITASSDAKIEVNRSFLWYADSIDDIRNYLIEDKVRRLDGDRKELLKCFRDHWGIDWEEAGIELSDIIEIRARRDIWVHNQGIVNNQYLAMVGESTSLERGQVAEIDVEYLIDCLDKLTRLVVYVHKVASEKHYAETDVS